MRCWPEWIRGKRANHGNEAIVKRTMIDLLLVNPSAKAETYGPLSELSAIEPPLWAALHAAYVREQGYSVAILDAEAEGLRAEETARAIADHNPLLVAIMVAGCNPSASSTPKMTAVSKTLRHLKNIAPHIMTALAGLHPSALPEKTLREEKPDFVCQGEAFNTLTRLISSLKAGNTEPIVPGLWWCKGDATTFGGRIKLIDPNELPMAAWDLLPMKKYRAHNWHCLGRERSSYTVVYTGLGCPHHCNFCPVHHLYDGKPGIRYRDPLKVAEEIDFLVRHYGVRNFKIMDEMFALGRERIIKVCECIASLGHGLNIWAYGRVDTADEAMLRKMKRAGINWVAYGIESASELVRQRTGKKFSHDKIKRAVEMTREAGINVLGNVIFGLPDDDMQTMQETLDMAKDFNFEWFNAYVAMPYPGSQLYQDAVRQGAKLPKKWADWGQYSEGLMPLPTKHVSGEEVLRFRDKAFEEYFDRPEYLSMVKAKFGAKAREHIEEMLRVKIRRGNDTVRT